MKVFNIFICAQTYSSKLREGSKENKTSA